MQASELCCLCFLSHSGSCKRLEPEKKEETYSTILRLRALAVIETGLEAVIAKAIKQSNAGTVASSSNDCFQKSESV